LVFGTAALCDALVRSAVYKSSYLLTYLLTTTGPIYIKLIPTPPSSTHYVGQYRAEQNN